MLSSSTTDCDTESIIPALHDDQIELICMRLETVMKKYFIHLLLVITIQNIGTTILYKYF